MLRICCVIALLVISRKRLILREKSRSLQILQDCPSLMHGPSGIERTGTKVPVPGTIVPFGDFAGTVPAVPAVVMTCGLISA
jgi:hypothetical protein